MTSDEEEDSIETDLDRAVEITLEMIRIGTMKTMSSSNLMFNENGEMDMDNLPY
jgi:hypothetical protein